MFALTIARVNYYIASARYFVAAADNRATHYLIKRFVPQALEYTN